MARDPKYDILFEPVPIGPKTMPNRFYQTPHCCGFGSERPGTQAHFRALKAEGGWGAVNTEFCSVHPESDSSPWISARLWDDSDIRNLGRMCDLVHEHGALAGVELWHGGGVLGNLESRLPARGAMAMANDTSYMTTTQALDKDGIREIQGYYVAAARRAAAAGFDIVNVHGAEGGAILGQFLMEKYNRRTDEYGGSFENRARFWRETLELVRDAVGDRCAVTARLMIDTLDGSELGMRAGVEGVGFIELCDHLVDFWDVQCGPAVGAEWAGEDAVPSRFAGEFSHRGLVEEVRRATSKPLVSVGRFTSPDTMAEVVRSGLLDIIGAARPSIADPFLPRKIEEGRLHDIRECIGCNICASRFDLATPLVCTQNATAGEEYRRGWHPETFDRAKNADNDVLVVGAGPAGLECALVLGRRGMRRVHLVDAGRDVGGGMRWIPSLPGLGEWGRVVNYREIQLKKLKNVEIVLGTRLDTKDVLEYGAELVVVATGSHWATDGLNGPTQDRIAGADASLPHVATPEQIMVDGKELPGSRVVVYDTDGYYMAASLAEKAARDGRQVTLVTPFATIAPFTFYTGEGFRLNRLLHELGVELVPNHLVTAIEPGAVTSCHGFAPQKQTRHESDGVILVTQRIPEDELFRSLKADPAALAREGIAGLFQIGDCVAPRLISECIFDGHRLGREIDCDDPGRALPFIRENRVLGASDADYDGRVNLRDAVGKGST